MAFSGRSAKFLDSLGVPEDYKGDVESYMESLKVVEDEGLSTGQWIAIGVVAAVVVGAVIVATGGLAGVGIAGLGGAAAGGGSSAGTALAGVVAGATGGTAAGAGTAAGGTLGAGLFKTGATVAFTKISELAIKKFTEASTEQIVNTGIDIYDQGSKLATTYKKNQQRQEREDFGRKNAIDAQANRDAGLQLSVDRLIQSFKSGAETIRSGLSKLEISLDNQEANLEASAKSQQLSIDRQYIKTEQDRATLELTTEDNIYKSNLQFDNTLFAIEQSLKNYNNSKEVLSAYRESSIVTAQSNTLNTYGEGQKAWSNVFTVTDATIGGESASAQSNRRLNQSSDAIIKLLDVQDQVHQKVFQYKNNLSDALLNIGEKRFNLDTKHKADKFGFDQALSGTGKTIDKVLKSYNIANIAIDRFLGTLDTQANLAQDNLIRGKKNLESVYAEALKSAGFQKNELLDNLNLATEEAYNRHEGATIAGRRLAQDPIDNDYDLKGTASLYKDLTSTGLPQRAEVQKIGDSF